MIQMPRRSVTRFFIPLIDVLILLFCIFLMMPLVKEGSAGAGESPLTAGQAQQLRQEMDRLRGRLVELERTRESPRELLAEIERLKAENRRALADRLGVRTLQIDATGALSYLDENADRVEVREQADALALVDRDRQRVAARNRELYYLVLYPREPGSLHPTKAEREQIERWFKGVQLGWDIPGEGPGGGTRP
jgi:hypothetical protein